jgi:hypothetical protein
LSSSGVTSTLRGSLTGISNASTAPMFERIESQPERGTTCEPLRELDESEDHATGQYRSGFSTKLHLFTYGGGLSLGAKTCVAHAYPSRLLKPVFGDGYFSIPTVRALLERRQSGAVIAGRGSQWDRHPHYSRRKPKSVRAAYRQRHFMEWCVGRLKEARHRHATPRTCTALPPLLELAAAWRLLKR